MIRFFSYAALVMILSGATVCQAESSGAEPSNKASELAALISGVQELIQADRKGDFESSKVAELKQAYLQRASDLLNETQNPGFDVYFTNILAALNKIGTKNA